MNDDEVGRLASALLKDLSGHSTDAGKVIAVARVLSHVRDAGRVDATLAHEDAVPWLDPAQTREPGPRDAPTQAELDVRARASGAMAQRLIDHAPGPITRYARALALAAVPAQLAMQWGERREFARVMRWVADASIALSTACPDGMRAGESPWAFVGACAMVGAVTDPTEPAYDPEMLIGLARRTVANLGSIARAAAAAEGRAECDAVFLLDDEHSSSVQGLEPYAARLCVAQLASFLGVPGFPVLDPDIVAQRAHIAKARPQASADPNAPPPGTGFANRSWRASRVNPAVARKRHGNGYRGRSKSGA